MKGLTQEEAIKALEEGKTLQFFDDGEWLDSSCKGDALRVEFNMNNGFIYRIKPTEEGKEVVMYGGCDIDDGLFKFNQWQYDSKEYKITFKVNEENEPTGEIRIERV